MKLYNTSKLIFVLVVFSISIVHAQEDAYVQEQLDSMVIADSLNLEDPLDGYLKIAAENNPRLKALFNRYLAVIERIPQVGTLPDPTIMFSYFTSPVETRVGATQGSVALNQAFPWFGLLRTQRDAVSQAAEAHFQVFEENRDRLLFNVRSTYYNLYVLEAAIRITEENMRLLESFRELANVKLESGKGSAVDLLRVEMDIAELLNELEYLKDSRLPIDTRFRELLNSNSIGQIVLPDTLITSEFAEGKDVLLDSIIINNPSLKKFDYEISSLISEAEAARKMGLPSFNIGLAYTGIAKRTDVPDFSGNGQDSFIFPQVGMTLPLYRKKYKAMVKEKELVKTSKVQEKEDRTNKLALDLEKSWRDYLDAQRRVLLFQRLTTLANQSLDILLAEYTSAGRDFEEILRMNRQLLKYELQLETARADQNSAVAYITYLTGEN